MAIRRILVPVDYSPCSGVALRYAAELAQTLGAQLDIVHAWDRPAYVSDGVMVRQPDGESRSLADMIRANAKSEMDDFLGKAGVASERIGERRLISGDPTAKVLDELKDGAHDLVIVGTHGRTGFEHALLGSFAEKLVRYSPVPVLTVRGPK